MSRLAKILSAALLAAVVVIPSQAVLGEIVIVVGDHDLLPNTPNQQIAISATGDQEVTGMILRLSLGDGYEEGVPANEPQFTAVDFGTSTIWSAYPFDVGTDPIFDSELEQSMAFTTPGNKVITNGVLATYTIDTTGYYSGTFDLKAYQTTISGQSIEFIVPGTSVPLKPDADPSFTITNGSINLVPEPAAVVQILALLSTAGVGLFLRRRKRQTG